MAAGWFRKLTVAGPAVFKSSVTATTGTLTNKTVTASGTVSGQTVSASSGVTGTKGLFEGVQKLSHSTGQAALNAYGLSVLSATANSTFTLGPPPAVGVLKHLALSTGTTTLVVKTTATIFGTTCTKITRVASKAALGKIPPAATLVGATGGKWALVSIDRSTACTLS